VFIRLLIGQQCEDIYKQKKIINALKIIGEVKGIRDEANNNKLRIEKK